MASLGSQIETGKVQPSVNTLYALASEVRASVDEMLFGEAPAAGAESSPPDAYQRHNGREWAYLVSGRLHVAVGFEEHVLEPGDSITYDSSTPHRLHNPGEEPAEAIWFVLG